MSGSAWQQGLSSRRSHDPVHLFGVQLFFNARKLGLSILLNLALLGTAVATTGAPAAESADTVLRASGETAISARSICTERVHEGMYTCTAGAFYKVRPEAGQLMLPYVAWLVFANILNIAGGFSSSPRFLACWIAKCLQVSKAISA